MLKPLRGHLRWFHVLAVVLLPLARAAAQQGATSFKHFHQYPTGQWQQQGQAYRNGAPFGQPISSTNCTGPMSPANAAAIKSLGNSAAVQCTTRVLTDTERLAESEQTCDMGGGTQVNHMTMHAVDDKTVATEIHVSINGHEVSESRLTNRYLGTCQPGNVGTIGNMPQMPKPSAEGCKQIAEMKQQAAESAKSCAAASASERAGCEAVMQRMTKQVETLAASCR